MVATTGLTVHKKQRSKTDYFKYNSYESKKGHYRISILNWPPVWKFFRFFHKKTKVCPLQRFVIELFGIKLFLASDICQGLSKMPKLVWDYDFFSEKATTCLL